MAQRNLINLTVDAEFNKVFAVSVNNPLIIISSFLAFFGTNSNGKPLLIVIPLLFPMQKKLLLINRAV